MCPPNRHQRVSSSAAIRARMPQISWRTGQSGTRRGRTPAAERSLPADARPRQGLPGRLDPAPPRLTQAVDAEGNQAKRCEDQQELAERLVAQGEQRLVDAARLGRLVGDGCL